MNEQILFTHTLVLSIDRVQHTFSYRLETEDYCLNHISQHISLSFQQFNAHWPSLWTEEWNSCPTWSRAGPVVSWCCPPTSTTPLSCMWTLAPGANQCCGLIGTRWTRRQMLGRHVHWPSMSKEHSNWGKPGMPKMQGHDKRIVLLQNG